MDGYTTTDQYPYSQSLARRGRRSPASFNYVRNSVKVTVDAYEGTVKFYVFDKKDPIIKAYREAFPDLFTDGSQMPAAIRAHLRYPEDLFKSQSSIVRPVPRDRAEALLRRQLEVAGVARPRLGPGLERHPVRGERRRGTASATSASNQPQAATSTGARSTRYYLNIRLPGQKDRALHRHGAVRAGVVGQQPDAPGVVPDRRLRPGAVRQAELVHDAAGPDGARPGAGEQRDHPHRRRSRPRSRC